MENSPENQEKSAENQENSPENEPQGCECAEKLKAKSSKVTQVVFKPDLHTNINSLKLKDKDIQDFVFTSIINRVQAVKNLEMTNVNLIKTESNDQNAILLKEMQSLVIEYSDFELLTYLNPTNLEHLRIVSKDFKPTEALTNFLTRCKHLHKLELSADDCDLMDFFTSTNFLFHLKHLTLSSTLTTATDNKEKEDNALNFFNRRCNSLQTLEIQARLPIRVLDFTLRKFRILRALKVRTNLIPICGDFYPQKHPKRSLKMLTLEGPFMDAMQIEGILRLYPVLQTISLENIYPDISPETVFDILKVISVWSLQLFDLSIPRLPWLTPDVKFKSLSILRLKYINHINEIKSIMKNAPNLQRFYVDHVFRGQSNEELIGILLSYNLDSLHIGAEPFEAMKILNLVERFPNVKLESLELRVHTFNFFKSYQFRFKELQGVDKNVSVVSQEMSDDLKDFVINEMLKLVGEQADDGEDDDSAVINYVMNSIEFS